VDPLPSIDLTGNLTDNLHEVLRQAARRGPLARDETTGGVVLLRQKDVDLLAHDQRLHGIGLALFDMMGITDGPLRDWYGRLMFTTEGDYHRRIRSLVARAFTPRSVGPLQKAAAEMAAEAITAVAPRGDLVAACSSLAARLTCRLLGVPDGDVPLFARWADALSPVFYVMTPDQIRNATVAIGELKSYVDDLTWRRTQDPGQDLITRLLHAEIDGERLSHEEAGVIISNLLVAGHDTTGSQIPCSILVVLQHRDEIGENLQDPTRLAWVAAETMRLEPSIPLIPRTAIAPIELHDTLIPAGSMVFLCIAAACRDESAWRNPDLFDPDRFSSQTSPRLLNFGAGTHYCVGAHLAKLAVEESVRAVLDHVPTLRLGEDPKTISWRRILGRSPTQLIVTAESP
jgi:cytochrome P450